MLPLRIQVAITCCYLDSAQRPVDRVGTLDDPRTGDRDQRPPWGGEPRTLALFGQNLAEKARDSFCVPRKVRIPRRRVHALVTHELADR